MPGYESVLNIRSPKRKQTITKNNTLDRRMVLTNTRGIQTHSCSFKQESIYDTRSMTRRDSNCSLCDGSQGIVCSQDETTVCHEANNEHGNNVGNTISEFMENHLRKLVEDISITETPNVKDIRLLVRQLVQFLIDQLHCTKPRLKISEIIPTGSCYEGTKILAPDEFDFLVVVDLGTEVILSSTRSDGFAKIEAKTDYKSGEDLVTVDDVIKSSPAFRNMFRRLFHSTVAMHTGVRGDAQSGFLKLEGFSVPINGPQCSLRALWCPIQGDSLEIFIDVTPTIKCINSIDVLNQVYSTNEHIQKTLANSKHICLIPRPHSQCDRSYKLVFDEAEKSLFSQLHDNHRKCLKLLKYFAILIRRHDFRLKKLFNSFAMKMAVYHHAAQCKETIVVSCCLRKIIRYLIECLACVPPALPSVFTPGRNIWSNLDMKDVCSAGDRNIAEEILTTIVDYLRLSKFVSFEEFIDNINAACTHVCSIETKKKTSA